MIKVGHNRDLAGNDNWYFVDPGNPKMDRTRWRWNRDTPVIPRPMSLNQANKRSIKTSERAVVPERKIHHWYKPFSNVYSHKFNERYRFFYIFLVGNEQPKI